jgi:hypothetical protein
MNAFSLSIYYLRQVIDDATPTMAWLGQLINGFPNTVSYLPQVMHGLLFSFF